MKCIDAALSRFNAVHDYPGEERLDERRFRLADVEGRPICCEMWPGNTADV
jgi:hypothetical protein